MHVLKSQANLYEPIEDLRLLEKLAVLYLPFDVIAEVTDFAVLHDYDQHFQGEIALLVGDNVLMVQVLEEIHLKHGGLLFFLLQSREHYFLGNVLAVFLLVPYKVSSAYNIKNRLMNLFT